MPKKKISVTSLQFWCFFFLFFVDARLHHSEISDWPYFGVLPRTVTSQPPEPEQPDNATTVREQSAKANLFITGHGLVIPETNFRTVQLPSLRTHAEIGRRSVQKWPATTRWRHCIGRCTEINCKVFFAWFWCITENGSNNVATSDCDPVLCDSSDVNWVISSEHWYVFNIQRLDNC